MKRISSVIFLVVFCLTLMGCEEQKKGAFLERGIALFEQGKYKEAELEIKSAIQEDTSVSEAHYYMALVNEKVKKYKAMSANLQEAIKLDPTKTKARLKLSKVQLAFNDVDSAAKEIEAILAANPEQLDALAIKASILIRQKKTEEALVIIDDVLAKNPDQIEALSLKVVVLMKKDQPEQALALLAPAMQKHGDNVSLHLLKIQLDSRLNDVEAVVNGYEKLVELKPNSLQAKFTLAKVYQTANKPDKAEGILKGLVDDNPGLINAKIALLNFIFVTDEERAMSQFDVFLEKYKNDYAKVVLLSRWLIARNKAAKARGILNSTIANDNISDKNKTSLTLVLARMDFSEKKYTEALSYVDSVLKDNIDNADAKLLKAEVQIVQRKYNVAVKLLEEILWQKPGMDQAISLLGRINGIQGNMDQARVHYENALKINPKNLQALNFIVAKQVAEGQTDYAIEILERALSLLPSQLMIMTKLAELNMNKSDWDAAKKYINKIQQQKNGVLLAEYLKGNVLQQQNKYEEAIVVYKAILEKAPWIKDALAGMAECYSLLNQQASMLVYLDGLIEKNPNIPYPTVLKSQLLSRNKEYKKAISFMTDVLKQGRMNDTPVYIELGRLYGISGDKSNQQKMYLEGLNGAPNNIVLMLHLASGYENTQQFDKAIELYEKILLINPRHNVSKNNLATVLIDHYGKDEDINKAVQIVESFKQAKQPYFLDTYGWAKLKSGNVEESLSIFKQVVILEPNVPVFRYHLAVAYNSLGNSMSASSELKQALYAGKGKDFPEKVLIEELLAKLKP